MGTHSLVNFTIEKSKLMHKISGVINERQEKVILRMFAEGIDGFKGGVSASNYNKITNATPATVTRNLGDLVNKSILYKTGEKKVIRYHRNIDIQPVSVVNIEDIL